MFMLLRLLQVVNGATAQAMMNRSAALVKWEGIMSAKTRKKVLCAPRHVVRLGLFDSCCGRWCVLGIITLGAGMLFCVFCCLWWWCLLGIALKCLKLFFLRLRYLNNQLLSSSRPCMLCTCNTLCCFVYNPKREDRLLFTSI